MVSDPIAVGGQTQYDITGGTRPGGGENLFHSFGEFGVPTNNIANFLNDSGLDTSNILARVTGTSGDNPNLSSIYGTIQTTGFENVNLFLMNPAGFLFGPNATVNVGGMVAVSSADYFKLADNARFNAIPNVSADALLSAFPVAAFGFLGSNPGAITVQGSQFTITEGSSISLVGGNITIKSVTLDSGVVQPAVLSAPAGQINFASAASPGEFLAGTLEPAPNINSQSFGALGEIQVSQKSLLDVSGDGGGSVMIRGGRLVVDDSIILANVTGPGIVTDGLESIGGGIDIRVSQDAVIQNGALLDTTVSGNASPTVQYSGVSIKADRIEILGSQDFENVPVTGIFSSVAQGNTGGSSGDIKLEGNSILVRDFGTVTTFLETATDGAGNAGNITLKTSGNLDLDGLVFVESLASASGNAGNIELTSAQGNILMTNSPFVNSLTSSLSSGSVGSIAVNAPNGDILLTGNPEFGPATLFTHIDGTGVNADKGGIQITAKNLTIENSGIQIDNFTSFQPGDLMVDLTDSLSLSGTDIPSSLLTTTRRSARSADLNITAHDILLADGSRASTETYRSGDGGTLNIFTQHLAITSGAQITSGSIVNPSLPPSQPPETPSGAGGTITVQGFASPAESVVIDGTGSGVFTDTQGTGAGGNIFVSAKTVTLQNGGTISASTSGTALSAVGGTIAISSVQSTTLNNGAYVTASSMGQADAGSIQVDAGDRFAMTDSSVTTEANQAGGGTIKITTNPNGTVQLTNSLISASVLDGTGGGGSVNIDPQFVILQNSQILAQAIQGPGGNISITTNLLLPDANSVISASSQFGVNGTVTIQSPNAPGSGQVQPLGKSPLQATSLFNQHCASLAGGEFSSFTVAGRDSLPTEPSSWLSSPLVAFGVGEGLGVRGEGMGVRGAGLEIMTLGALLTGETALLSLRQIAPPGFLTQAFAVDWSTGCAS